MKIVEIHVCAHDLPVRNGPYRIAGSTVWSLQTTRVKVVTDSGLTGLGETCPVGLTYQPQHALATFRDICEARALAHTCDDAWGGDIFAAACTQIAATVQPRLTSTAITTRITASPSKAAISRCHRRRGLASRPTQACSARRSRRSADRTQGGRNRSLAFSVRPAQAQMSPIMKPSVNGSS